MLYELVEAGEDEQQTPRVQRGRPRSPLRGSQIGRKSRALGGAAAPTAPRRTLLPTLTVLTTFFRSSHLTQSRPMVLVCVEAPCWCGHCREAYNLDGVFISFCLVSLLRVHMYRDAELLKMPQLKHTLLFRCVSIHFFSTYPSNPISWCRRFNRITKATLLTFP